MAENNSSAPLKTAEGAVHPHLIALRTIAEYPITAPMMNIDAANMQRIAVQAVVQAEPVALQMCSELRPRTESEKAAYLAGVADGRMYAERDAETAPQAQPAPKEAP